MKEKIIAIVILVLIPAAVIANTLFLNSEIEELISKIDELNYEEDNKNDIKAKAEAAYNQFRDTEIYYSFTVSHDDLTNIEDCFVEMVGYLSVGDLDNAKVTQSRLINSLEHLRRLSGFNIDAII